MDEATESPATLVEGSARETRDRGDALTKGTIVGRYIVIEHIGSGGMGSVYSAYDPELNRKIALKVMAGRDQDRVLREAQSLARLSHPNVVAVYDVGTFGSRVFIAMELVPGKTLAEWSREARRPWREVIAMYAAAGRGLAAAHSAGIVHRDFKPANVLVGDDGRPRVLDFGLARAATQADPEDRADDFRLSVNDALASDLTVTGSLLGTPVYMPPEAFRGGTTGAVGDQFSFCVALYEALYGARPYEGNWIDSADPPTLRPLSDDRGVPARIRKLLVRGLAEKPQDRFATLDELLAALEYDPAVRRRRIVAALAATLGVAVLVVALVHRPSPARAADDPCATTQPPIWNAAARERVHAAFRATGLRNADAHFDRAARALENVTADWTTARRSACLDTRSKHVQPEAVLVLRLACLDRHRQDLLSLIDLFAHADATVAEQAAKAVLDLPEPASCSNARSLVLLEPPPPPFQGRVAEIRRKQSSARALRSTSKSADAIPIAKACLDDARAIGYQPAVAESLELLALLQTDSQDFASAATLANEALRVAISTRLDALAAVAAADRVWIATQAGNAPDAVTPLIDDARAWVTRSGDPEPASSLEIGLASLAIAQGNAAEALDHYRRAESGAASVYGPDSTTRLRQQSNVAAALILLGRHDEAITLMMSTIDATSRVFGDDSPELAGPLDNLAWSLAAMGRTDEARAALERALAIPSNPDGLRGALMCDMARTLVAAGNPQDAIHWGEQGIAKIRAVTTGFNLAVNEDPLAAAYLGTKRYKDALAQTRECLAVFHKDQATDTPSAVPCLAIEGTALLELGDARAALVPLEAALRLQTGTPAAPGVLANLRFQLSRALLATGGDRSRAAQLADQAREELAKYEFKRPQLAELDQWRATSGLAR